MMSSLAQVIDSELLSKIESRTAHVGVIGLSYVGLPLLPLVVMIVLPIPAP